MYHIFYFLLCLVYIPLVYFRSSPLSIHVVSPRIPNPTNRLHQPNPIRLARHTAPKTHAPTTNTTPAAFAVRTQCFVVFALFAIFFCLSACFSRSTFFSTIWRRISSVFSVGLPSASASPSFWSRCWKRSYIAFSSSSESAGAASGSCSVAVFPSSAFTTADSPSTVFRIRSHFFLPSSAPVSFSAVLLFLSFSSSSVPRHFPCCNRS